MNIVCTFDDNYLPHVAAMLTTLRDANPGHWFHVSLVHSGRNLEEVVKLYKYISSILNRVNLIQFDEGILSGLPVSGHLTPVAYARLALPGILPAEFDRVLYLDPDIAVVGDLQPLYESDLRGHPLGAVPDYYELQESNRLCLRPESGYFNSGVLLINLKLWRQVNLLEKASILMANRPELIAYADQDVLNYQYQGDWLRLDRRWNYQTMSSLDDRFFHPGAASQDQPSIIHFVGPAHSKPWHVNCVNPYCSVFRNAKRSTPWGKTPLTGGPPSLTIKVKSRIKQTISYFRAV